MINSITDLINEIKSYFVPEKTTYKIEGKCKQCGKCCNHIYSLYTYSEQEFKFMQIIFPSYKRFYIKGKDEEGNFIFACKDVTKDGKCSVYKKRPAMCRRYPSSKIKFRAELPDGCGYKVIEKKFDEYLTKK